MAVADRARPLLTLIRSRDFGALGTTVADQDFLVELRDTELRLKTAEIAGAEKI